MSRVRQSPLGQSAAKCYPISIAASTDNVSVGGAANQAATVAFAAQGAGLTEQGSWLVGQVVWSYAGTTAVAGGRLTIADSSGNLLDMDIYTLNGQNFGIVPYAIPMASQLQNSALTVTLGAVANVTGKLSVTGWLEV